LELGDKSVCVCVLVDSLQCRCKHKSEAAVPAVATIVAPAKVTISGHQNAKAGDTVKLSCVSAISNPPSVITWFTRGRHIPGSTSNVMPSAQVTGLLLFTVALLFLVFPRNLSLTEL